MFMKKYALVLSGGGFKGAFQVGALRFLKKNWNGYFWAYFDPLRPRYAKTGFYFAPLPSGDALLLHLTENVTKDFHEPKILEILESIQF
ncbi:MAG: hypothetical protein HUU45_12520 [Leptospiraceae bacterium]|nr:hypothetical protein [Leptospiraceae bacterium]